MSKDTAIQYADSSLNLMMGCEGCELWHGGNRSCYAGTQTAKYAGKKGWPAKFESPVIFPERMANAESWGDLYGYSRDGAGKPWLNGMPRVVFLNDMGDTFTAKLPLDWLAAYMKRIAASPHIYLLLTKRPSRMAAFAELHPFPANVWPGTTVTSEKTLARVRELQKVQSGGPKWLSVEPMWEKIGLTDWLEGISWCVFGGESRQDQHQTIHPLDIMWLASGIKECRNNDVHPFVKQLGAQPFASVQIEGQGITRAGIKLRDPHGGDWREWPEELRIREMPKVPRLETGKLL